MNLNDEGIRKDAVLEVSVQLQAATDAKKCHACGCFRRAVETLTAVAQVHGDLSPALDAARAALLPEKYDCLGCEVCFPAIAANAFEEAFPGEIEPAGACPGDAPGERVGWPPLPGDYRALRFGAPVAICTLNSAELARRIAEEAPEGVSIVGTLHTENLGIERVVRNVVANPHIRFLVVCGEDTRQAIGHLPGQSLASLCAHGVDDAQRIVNARGKRPVLKNVSRDQVEAFRRQVELVALVGEERIDVVRDSVRGCAARDPGVFPGATCASGVPTIPARAAHRLVLDPSGFFVVYPDQRRKFLAVEHYTTAGVLDCVIEGATPGTVAAEVIDRGLLSRMDHAAYLGRELPLRRPLAGEA